VAKQRRLPEACLAADQKRPAPLAHPIKTAAANGARMVSKLTTIRGHGRATNHELPLVPFIDFRAPAFEVSFASD
jgi:hypothetical protein